MIFDMTKRTGGEEYFTVPSTGCIYPRVLNQTLTGFSNYFYSNCRWYGCTEMEEATIAGLTSVEGGSNSDTFRDCTKLKKLILPDLTKTTSHAARNCTSLEEARLGSIGTAVTALSRYTFSGCTQSGLVITVYVDDNTAIPLADSPWGATNATIVYRSSTTGEVRTV